ncbi:lysozyme [Alcaligenaceae bacterium]|nr:lysozyme [Alcaligenaceae bacterium]
MKHKIIAFFFVGGATLLAANPDLMRFLGVWEGEGQNIVYADKLAGGLPTVCKGITKYTSPYPVVVGERWSDAKCKEVETQVVIDTQRELQKCIKVAVPQRVWDALTSHAHNVGWPATCKSASVSAINAGDIERGCDLLAYKPNGTPNWSNVGNNFIQGLHNRRKAERIMCLSGLK